MRMQISNIDNVRFDQRQTKLLIGNAFVSCVCCVLDRQRRVAPL